MRLQLLSDLHLETEAFDPLPAPDADVLVLAGDIDASWAGLERFADWPVPVLLVAGNHEFDGCEWNDAWPALRAHASACGVRLLERETLEFVDGDGRRVRLMRATRDGRPFDAAAVRAEALACRHWLAQALAQPHDCDATVVVTHFAPSAASADPRFGQQPSTASFCNDDDALLVQADLWLHGHVHCCHDYAIVRNGRPPTRVVCNARGLADKNEGAGFDPLCVVEV